MNEFMRKTIEEFRAKGGKGLEHFGDRVLLLNTKGAKSGEDRVIPLAYSRDGDRLVIIASKGGSDTHPMWFHNLLANPHATVEVGSESGIEVIPVKAHVADPEERRRLFDKQAEAMPGFKEYEKKTERIIPVVVLEPIKA